MRAFWAVVLTWLIASSLAIAIAAEPGADAAVAAAPSAHIVLLHVNDPHGQTQGITVNGKPWGGYARLSTMVDELRKKEGADHVVLFHAGDEFSRGDEMTSTSLGQANIDLMNKIGFAAWVPGNGDFYVGPANLQKRIAQANFPTLAANVTYRFGGEPLAKNTVVIEVQGVKIGLLGLCYVRKEHPSAFPLRVLDPIETAKRIIPELRKQADIVIALTHLGLEADRQLAAQVGGIDMIVGGHSHTVLLRGYHVNDPDGKRVLIVQAGDQLRYLGRVDLQLTRADGRWQLNDATPQLIPLDSLVPQDPAIKAMIARMWPASQPSSVPTSAPVGVD